MGKARVVCGNPLFLGRSYQSAAYHRPIQRELMDDDL